MVESEKLIEDELIAGAIDLHAHGYPEVTLKFRGRVTDHQWAETARSLKMGGFVMISILGFTIEERNQSDDQWVNKLDLSGR
jgi:tRNA-dihydrouridine synthase